ncbi:MAG: hypothetical protein HDS37_06360 [Bacteroides sp.]|nr:hypothetical protein [Bacteroides sp.]
MIYLDKIILSVPRNCITAWHYERPVYNSIRTGLPYHLYIGYDERFGSYKVEFSAKVLGDHYSELINQDNIKECLNIILALGICSFNTDEVLQQGTVIGADFTKDILLRDIPCANDMRDVKSILRLSIPNYDRWICANYQGGGMIISNVVSDARRRKRLTVYNKGDELSMASNRPFMQSLNDRERLEEYFKGRVRFELRATTTSQICGWLGFERGQNTIVNVLASTANPLRVVMAEMFEPINAVEDDVIRRTLTNLDKISTLKMCEWDLVRVEQHVRASTTRSIKESMKAYAQLHHAHKCNGQAINIVDVVGD